SAGTAQAGRSRRTTVRGHGRHRQALSSRYASQEPIRKTVICDVPAVDQDSRKALIAPWLFSCNEGILLPMQQRLECIGIVEEPRINRLMFKYRGRGSLWVLFLEYSVHLDHPGFVPTLLNAFDVVRAHEADVWP